MKFLSDFIKGIIIGIGAVAPGVSGGSFAVMLGVYDKLTDAIANIFHNLINKIKTLFPLGIGICVGVLGFSRVMKYLFEHHESQVKFLFIGLMLGTLPYVFKEANKKGFKRTYILPCIIAFSITVLFMILENSIIDIIPESSPSLIALIIYGVIIGFGTIVPGVSSSFILMYIGAYEMLLDGIVSMDLMVIMPVGVGFGLSILLFANIINYLFKKAYGYTYYAILGFVMGSIISIAPPLDISMEFLFGFLICLVGCMVSYKLSRLGAVSQESENIC
ncbi:MAG: DUF368 domain-containing protein [Clostridiales bacterium]|nr:DUF368 domain-containing protein [Clostridiales bacterium]